MHFVIKIFFWIIVAYGNFYFELWYRILFYQRWYFAQKNSYCEIKYRISLADLSNYEPTQFQPVGLCKKSTGNQPCSNLHIGKRLVFVEPTVIPTMYFKVQRLERGWFFNQPSFQL